MLIIAYSAFAYKAYYVAQSGNWSGGNFIWMFHSSILAFVGTVLAIELYTSYSSAISMLSALTLLVLPVIGALRQHFFTIIPILLAGLKYKKKVFLLLLSIFAITISFFIFPFVTLENQSYIEALQKKSGGFSNYVNPSQTINDDSDTFQHRFVWWEEAVSRTVRTNPLFGHILSYRFNHNTYSSGMLHSQFATVFADGGIFLLSIVVALYTKYFYLAYKSRYYIGLLAMYAFIILISMNAWAHSNQSGFIAFYIYGYYANRTKIALPDK